MPHHGLHVCLSVRYCFYRAIHYSAQRGIAMQSNPVCLSVFYVHEARLNTLMFSKNNITTNYPRDMAHCTTNAHVHCEGFYAIFLSSVWCTQSIVLTVKGGSAVIRWYFTVFYMFIDKTTCSIFRIPVSPGSTEAKLSKLQQDRVVTFLGRSGHLLAHPFTLARHRTAVSRCCSIT